MNVASVAITTLAVLTILSTPVTGQSVRFEWPDPNLQLTGYLTSNGGTGGIAWDPAAKSDSNHGAVPTEQQDQQYKASMDVYAFTGQLLPNRAVQPVAEFTSAPLPKTLHLDPRKNIELDLFLSRYSAPYNDPCASTSYSYVVLTVGGAFADPWLTVEIKADGKTIAGHWRASYINWYPWNGFYPPPSPGGYAACRYRFHPQATDLQEGTILSVTITPILHSKGFQIGTGEDHQSVIRLTGFTPEEWVFRNPSTGGDTSSQESVEATAGDGRLVLLVAGLAIAPFTASRRGRAPLAAMILLAGAFAGCLGGAGGSGDAQSGDGSQGKITSTLIPDKEQTITSKGNGSIVGVVMDPFNLPLAGVHVGILGTNFFETTSKSGHFSLRDLPPATYTLRFDKKDYKSFETQIEVKAGFISRPQITLYPLVEKEGDAAPHRHDYWAGESKKTLLSGPVSSYFGLPAPEPGAYNSVLPGTYLMEATISWDAGARHQIVALWIRHNLEPGAYNSSLVGLVKNGQPVLIPVTWEMSDPGHQPFSTWNFQIEADPRHSKPTPGPPFCFLVCANVNPDPPVQYAAKLIIHRGVVPREPAHPDHWIGQVEKPVFSSAWTSSHGTGQTQYALQSCLPDKPCYYNQAYFSGTVGLVPFDAQWLEVYLNKTQEPSTKYDYNLKFTTALKGGGQMTAQKPMRSGLSTRYVIPLEAGWADLTYATKSGWYFTAVPSDQAAANQDTANPVAPNYGVKILVTAHKSPVPA